ncbi:MAG: EVE domain-containing protein [Sphingomonas phyllosphaerae]|uniref:EVE domain-containing protein n=1 Tax=Sphingomonas phyllosphaerae TaxID=257003 RepID=UPI002FF83B2E
MAHWLLKTEPDSYGWDDLVHEGETEWTGVRNHAAAAHLRAMEVGDLALIYHSGAQKAAVGVAEVTRAARVDGAAPWVSVAVTARNPLPAPVTLATMKAMPALAGMAMLRQSRLSVSPVTVAEWAAITGLADQMS